MTFSLHDGGGGLLKLKKNWAGRLLLFSVLLGEFWRLRIFDEYWRSASPLDWFTDLYGVYPCFRRLSSSTRNLVYVIQCSPFQRLGKESTYKDLPSKSELHKECL